MGSLLLGLYFSCLVQFMFVSHPVSYCGLLLVSSLSGIGYCVLTLGLSWYAVLFCLVYVGGIYILFIFVSVQNPNPITQVGGSLYSFLFSLVFGFVFIRFFIAPSLAESSHYLCSFFEGFSYCLFCLVLVLGFIIVSGVLGDKCSFYR
uniref:NADH dehydrogenase subunit 6 n=1 Tax=Azygia hwangtsiyui TaxID=2752791 RepID=A0A7D5PEM6_9TREM|nr:NADH dehydrogenase subunit 6 [Azygia hwangtsiyui]QLH90217.1 NADH dehydrogenase subunit 6 [Azygia hwangtsiyui]